MQLPQPQDVQVMQGMMPVPPSYLLQGLQSQSTISEDSSQESVTDSEEVFHSYNLIYGPFNVDACADNYGSNAQCENYWSPSNSYALHSWGGLKVWCNPPFSEIAEVLDHAIASYYDDPDHSTALLVLPDWLDTKWLPHMTDSGLGHCVGYYPAGTQLFTVPPVHKGQRRVMSPTKWGVCMVMVGENWGNGICLPWQPLPPVQPPTVPRVAARTGTSSAPVELL